MEQNEREIDKRIEKLRRKFQQNIEKPSVPPFNIRESVLASFSEIKEQIDGYELESNEIINKLARHSKKVQNITPKSQPETDITAKITTPHVNAKGFAFGMQQTQQGNQLIEFEKRDNKIFKVEEYFRKVPVRDAYLHEVDVSLKPENVFFLPFQRDQKYNELRDMMIRQEDTYIKHQLQYNIHCLGLREYIDLLCVDLLPDHVSEEVNVSYQLREGKQFCILNKHQYEVLLEKYKILSKYFFQNKKTVVQSLKLGELRTQERSSFQYLIDSLSLTLQIWDESFECPQLKSIWSIISNTLESKLQQTLTALTGFFYPNSTSEEYYVRVYDNKSKLLRGSPAKELDLLKMIGPFLLGFSKEEIYHLMDKAGRAIRQTQKLQAEKNMRNRLKALVEK